MLKRQRIFCLYFVAVAMLFSGCAKTVVKRVTKGAGTDLDGVFYALPRTVVTTSVPVKKVVKAPGKFLKFARCFFPEDVLEGRVIKEKKTEFSLKEPVFSSRGEPDPKEIFVIKVPGHFFEDKALKLDLTADGIMTAGEASSTNHALEIATNAIKTFVPIIGSLSSSGAASAAAVSDSRLKDNLSPAQKDCLEKNFPKVNKSSNEIDAELKEAKKTNPAITRADIDTMRDSDDLIEAKKAYDAIIELQKKRDTLVGGGIAGLGLPKETLELMLKQIDDRIKTLVGLFLGRTTEMTWAGIFEFTPDQSGSMEKTLFQYEPDKGICEINYSGLNPVDPDFAYGFSCQNPVKVILKLTLGKRRQVGPQFADQIKNASLKENGERGFYYRIPAQITASVEEQRPGSGEQTATNKPKEIGFATMAVAQLGLVVSLPAGTNSRTTKYTLALYEASGAMKNFTLGSDALIQKTQVEDVGAAVGSIVEIRNQRRAAEAAAQAAASDELKQLERRRLILEELVKIKEAEEKLKNPAQ